MSSYQVYGGSGGLTVEFTELRDAAVRLRALAEDLQDRRRTVGSRQGLISFGAPPAHAAAAREIAVARLEAAVWDLIRAGSHLTSTAEKVDQSVSRYLETEGRIVFQDPAVNLARSFALWRTPGSASDGQAVEALVGSPLIAQLAGILFTRVGGSRKEAVLKPTGETVEITGAASFLADRSRRLHQEASGDIFEILVRETAEGRTFIVTLPGTQSEGDLFDTSGLADATTAGSARTAALIGDALRKAGATPEDAVVLNGYSQGGIHSANSAAPLIEAGFNVQFVMTSGAPTGDIDTPPGVTVLSLEHGQDMVPGLDGLRNPDTADRTTMVMADPVTVAEGADKGLGPGHRLENYERAARIAESAPEQSLQDCMSDLRAIIGPGAAAGAQSVARVIRVGAESVPHPAPRIGTVPAASRDAKGYPSLPGPPRRGGRSEEPVVTPQGPPEPLPSPRFRASPLPGPIPAEPLIPGIEPQQPIVQVPGSSGPDSGQGLIHNPGIVPSASVPDATPAPGGSSIHQDPVEAAKTKAAGGR